MKKFILGSLFGVLLGAAAALWITRAKPAAEVSPPKSENGSSEAKENPLRFPRAKRDAAGIVLISVESAAIDSGATAYGRVLDPAPLIQLMAELDSARAVSAVSEKEKDRAEKLLAVGGNASAQNVETAQSNAARDHAAVVSAEVRLMSSWGRAVVEKSDEIRNAIAAGGSLARLDALPGDGTLGKVGDARVTLAGENKFLAAEILGPAQVSDPQMLGAGYLIMVPDHALPVGAALRGKVSNVSSEPQKLPVVPTSAIVYHQGSAWIFVLGEEDTFERKLVTIGRALSDERVAINQGVSEGDQVVATGAQQILAAELQASWAGGEAD